MQSVLSKIGTHVTMSISYDNNHFMMDTFLQFSVIINTPFYFFWREGLAPL